MMGTRVRNGLLIKVPKSPAVYGDLVEAKEKSNQRRQYRMKPKEGREGNEYSDGKSKRRPLRWIVQREQTAKSHTKHGTVSSFEFRGSS